MKLWNYTSSYAVAHSVLSLETTGHNSQLTAHTCYMKVNAKGTSLNKKNNEQENGSTCALHSYINNRPL